MDSYNIINKFQTFNTELDTPYLYAAGVIRSVVDTVFKELEQEFHNEVEKLMNADGTIEITNINPLEKYYYSKAKLDRIAILIDEVLREVIPEDEFNTFKKFLDSVESEG